MKYEKEMLILKPIKDYIEYELNIFRDECNFTEEELSFFNYKAKDYSNVRISLEMNLSQSTVYRLSKSVSDKMRKVEKLYLTE